MEKREQKHKTLVLAYEVKALHILGSFPVFGQVRLLAEGKKADYFSVKDGGAVCGKCRNLGKDALIYAPKFDIVSVLKFFLKTPVESF